MRSSARSGHLMPAVAVVVVWALISTLLVLSGVHVWPAGGKDAQFMLPPAVEYRSSGELLHPFWQKARLLDPTGEGRLVYHGFLFQLVVGTCAPSTGYASCHLVVMLILVTALGLFALGVLRVLRRFGEVPVLSGTFFGGLAVGGLATALLGFHARPEPLGMLLASGAFLAMTRLDERKHWIPAGLALGLLAVTSPLPAFLGLLLYGMYIHIRLRQGAALASLLAAGCVAALVAFLIARFWYPYAIGDWIAGLRAHWVSNVTNPTQAVYYWFTTPRNSFYGLLYLLAFGLGLHVLARRRAEIRSKAGFALLAAILVVSVLRFKLYIPGQNYNVLVFSPLAYLAVIFMSIELSQDQAIGAGIRTLLPALRVVVALTFLLTCVGFARTVITFPKFLSTGVSHGDAKARLEEVRAIARASDPALATPGSPTPGSVLIGPALYALVDDYDGLSVLEMAHDAVSGDHDAVVLAQVGLARQSPPQLDGYRLIEDRFEPAAPRFLRIKIANSSHGYSYAVYQRER